MNREPERIVVVLRPEHIALLNETLTRLCYVLFLIALIVHGPVVLELLRLQLP